MEKTKCTLTGPCKEQEHSIRYFDEYQINAMGCCKFCDEDLQRISNELDEEGTRHKIPQPEIVLN